MVLELALLCGAEANVVVAAGRVCIVVGSSLL